MLACVFSGQGSQKAGMGQDLCQNSPAARKIYAEAAKQLGFDLLQLAEEQLATTRYAQLSIVTLSLAAWEAFWENRAQEVPLAFAGFSLGEYSALGASGVLSFADLLTLVDERARLMQQTAEANPGAMYAVLGLDDARLLEVVAQKSYAGQVFAVNFNSPGQIVIAGKENAAAACAEELKSAGARRLVKLNVNGAFHTPLMQPAADHLADFARRLTFHEPSAPFFTNSTGAKLEPGQDWPSYLAAHMCNPVRWTAEVLALQQGGCGTFLEFGPGKVLTGLIRKIIPGSLVFPIEDSSTLQDAHHHIFNHL